MFRNGYTLPTVPHLLRLPQLLPHSFYLSCGPRTLCTSSCSMVPSTLLKDSSVSGSRGLRRRTYKCDEHAWDRGE